MYKILLLGTNAAVIDDFFRQMDNDFELLSSSLLYEDIMAHIKYVNPDAIIYCLKNEPRECMHRITAVKQNLKTDIPIIIIGNEVDCNDFTHCAINIAEISLIKPLTAKKIRKEIIEFLDKRESVQEPDENESKDIISEKEPVESSLDDDLLSVLKSIENLTESISNPRKHILIVDDDFQMLKTIKRHLEADYDTATAINGELALRFLKKKHTDLILLDYEMPEMKGDEVLEQIRANKETQDIPVIFLTGIAERDKIQKVLALKPQGYLLKPTDRETLLTKVSAVLG